MHPFDFVAYYVGILALGVSQQARESNQLGQTDGRRIVGHTSLVTL